MPDNHITALEELRDWLQDGAAIDAILAPNRPFHAEWADALSTALSLLAEREKMVAEKQKPLFEMSLAELQSLRGQVDSFIHFKVCGDPRIRVSFPVAAAPQPPKGKQ